MALQQKMLEGYINTLARQLEMHTRETQILKDMSIEQKTRSTPIEHLPKTEPQDLSFQIFKKY